MLFIPFERVIALVDCNNFYVSCERVFAPRLEGKPVAVLSNNDGCVIARSEELKTLGVAMGTPVQALPKRVHAQPVQVLSSNYALYGDMSARVMQVLAAFTPRLEVYSIDEAFLDLTGLAPATLTGYAREMVQTVRRWTGIPVSIGIGPPKTLAKMANRLAKTAPVAGSVCELLAADRQTEVLARLPVAEVWGIGACRAGQLRALGIETALQLRDSDPQWLRIRFTVVMQRLVYELRGVACLPLEEVAPPRRQLRVSRAFGRPVTRREELQQAIAAYTARAAVKRRRQHALVQTLLVWIQTHPFRNQDRQHHDACACTLPTPTGDSGRLIHAAVQSVTTLYRPGCRYHKAGVLFLDLASASATPPDLFGDPETAGSARSPRLMAVMDRINTVMGPGTLRSAREGFQHPWAMRQARRSPAYTTRWSQLPWVK